jgi:hypothetical protein
LSKAALPLGIFKDILSDSCPSVNAAQIAHLRLALPTNAGFQSHFEQGPRRDLRHLWIRPDLVSTSFARAISGGATAHAAKARFAPAGCMTGCCDAKPRLH